MHPDPSDVLLTMAEVAAAFVGFASIVAIFQRRGGASDFDVFRFWILLEFGLAALFFALLPLVLHFLGLAAPRVWAAAGAGMACFVIAHMAAVYRLRAKRVAVVMESLTPALSAAGLFVQWSIVALGIGNLVLRDFGAYLLGLSLLLLAAAVNFVRLVRVGMPALRG